MAFLDTKNYTPDDSQKRTLMEPGEYAFELVDHEGPLTTRNGTGKRIKAVFECVDARHAGQKIFHNWNVKNDSQKAVSISTGEIFAISKALGIDILIDDYADAPRELNKLMDAPILCTVTIEKGKGSYVDASGVEQQRGDQNRISAFGPMPVGGAQQVDDDKPRGRLSR